MKSVAIGNSDLAVAPLALGGNVFGWTADEATSFAILDAFVDAGGDMIDTADVYSAWVPGHQGGESEAADRAMAQARSVQARRGRDRDQGRFRWCGACAARRIGTACEASLERLGIDEIDLYYHHKDDPAVSLADSLGAFGRAGEGGARSGRSACRNIRRRAARSSPCRRRAAMASSAPVALFSPGTICVERGEVRGRASRHVAVASSASASFRSSAWPTAS